jgi:transposase
MSCFVEGTDREQATLFPECLEDWICEDNPVRAVDVFVDGLDLAEHGFSGIEPEATGRPSYHPSVLLKLYIYGYLNRVQSSRRLEREAGRNVEAMWLTGRLVPDHKTIADFRKDNGPAIRNVCAQFVALCRELGLLMTASVAIDGSKFKAVNTRDKKKLGASYLHAPRRDAGSGGDGRQTHRNIPWHSRSFPDAVRM